MAQPNLRDRSLSARLVAKDPHDRIAKLASYQFYVLKKKNANTKTYMLQKMHYNNPSDCHLANKTLFSFSFHDFLFFSRHLTLHVLSFFSCIFIPHFTRTKNVHYRYSFCQFHRLVFSPTARRRARSSAHDHFT
jgi:hypothetical protein